MIIPERLKGKRLRQVLEMRNFLIECAKSQKTTYYEEVAKECDSINNKAWRSIGGLLGDLSEIENDHIKHELNSLVRHKDDNKVGSSWTGGDRDPEIYTQRAFNRYK